MKIEPGCRAAFHYTLKDDDGQILDSSEGGQPLSYTAGAGEIVPGLEHALMYREAGEHLDISVAPQEGYGLRDENAVHRVNRKYLAGLLPQLEEGMAVQADTENGPRTFFISEIGSDSVILDANHPLAGLTLHFSVDIVSVTPPGKIKVDY